MQTQQILRQPAALTAQGARACSLFFIQMKVDGHWVFLHPLHQTYGYVSIEACERAITELEETDDMWDLDFQYRLKEELV